VVIRPVCPFVVSIAVSSCGNLTAYDSGLAPQPGKGQRGHNGGVWEWSSSTMDAHEGYLPSRIYPGYSSDFFDGSHNVVVSPTMKCSAYSLYLICFWYRIRSLGVRSPPSHGLPNDAPFVITISIIILMPGWPAASRTIYEKNLILTFLSFTSSSTKLGDIYPGLSPMSPVVLRCNKT
jgi:hypothetical protein